MKTLQPMFMAGLLLALWFAGATATLTQLAAMGGTLEAVHAAERAHQVEVKARLAAHAAMHEGHAETSRLTQSRRF